MEKLKIAETEFNLITLNTVVVGAGAAGLNAADCLFAQGVKDIAVLCESLNLSTSRNTGSDKQTYYKLSLAGGEGDSVRELAKTFFNGQCTDGDTALAEAALSAQCFLRYACDRVPFPVNRFGEYIGYRTDHDNRLRATSAGPLTSKLMVEALERSVKRRGVNIIEGEQVITVISSEGRVHGLISLNIGGKKPEFTLFNCANVVFATGGPAYLYFDSVFPLGHFGANGIAFDAGIVGRNLTEWQHGLASKSPRWNVSGSYMQVLPRFFSTDKDLGDERDFLLDAFGSESQMLNNVFLKGYEWPFDVRKAKNGSSLIDLIVYKETCHNERRVFLDYTRNPVEPERPMDFSVLSPEARGYLERAGALFGTPFQRLEHLNAPSVQFYRDNGVDLAAQPLEIALSVQHNNGGLAVDAWWQTNIRGFFAVGEAAGTHGVYRPGGSALNAGQVGSARAAQYIAHYPGETLSKETFVKIACEKADKVINLYNSALTGSEDADKLRETLQKRMSRCAAPVRDRTEILAEAQATKDLLDSFDTRVRISTHKELGGYFRLRDMLICRYVYLNAMNDYIEYGGLSRGSAIYTDRQTEISALSPEGGFAFLTDDGRLADTVQETYLEKGECISLWRKVKPIPDEEDTFENVWRSFRENGNVY